MVEEFIVMDRTKVRRAEVRIRGREFDTGEMEERSEGEGEAGASRNGVNESHRRVLPSLYELVPSHPRSICPLLCRASWIRSGSLPLRSTEARQP